MEGLGLVLVVVAMGDGATIGTSWRDTGVVGRGARFALENAGDGAGDQVWRGHGQGALHERRGLGAELGARTPAAAAAATTTATGGRWVALGLAGHPLPVPVGLGVLGVGVLGLMAVLVDRVQAVGAVAIAVL